MAGRNLTIKVGLFPVYFLFGISVSFSVIQPEIALFPFIFKLPETTLLQTIKKKMYYSELKRIYLSNP
jgi:hypothetical protein